MILACVAVAVATTAQTPASAPAGAPPASAGVTLIGRGGESLPSGEYLGISSLGVTLGARIVQGAKPLPQVVVSWDRVLGMTGDLGPDGEKLASYLETGALVWRARRRLERGDLPGAEALFERAFEELRLKAGPTAAVAAEGLLRCRLRRGAHTLAIDPWLSTLSARAGVPGGVTVYRAEWWSDAGLAPAIDPTTGLVAALPPIWLGWESVRAFGLSGDGEEGVAAREGKAAALLALYRAAARFEAGRDVEMPRPASDDPGVGLVAAIVRSRVSSEEQRAVARRTLEDRLRTASAPWIEAWCRAALGRSLLQEASLDDRQRGVLELLQLPARFKATHPYLAGVALAESSVALAGMGDEAGAKVLRQELAREYPTHPALEWHPIRSALAGDAAEGVAVGTAPEVGATPDR